MYKPFGSGTRLGGSEVFLFLEFAATHTRSTFSEASSLGSVVLGCNLDPSGSIAGLRTRFTGSKVTTVAPSTVASTQPLASFFACAPASSAAFVASASAAACCTLFLTAVWFIGGRELGRTSGGGVMGGGEEGMGIATQGVMGADTGKLTGEVTTGCWTMGWTTGIAGSGATGAAGVYTARRPWRTRAAVVGMGGNWRESGIEQGRCVGLEMGGVSRAGARRQENTGEANLQGVPSLPVAEGLAEMAAKVQGEPSLPALEGLIGMTERQWQRARIVLLWNVRWRCEPQQQRVLGSDVAATGLHPTDGQCCAMMEHTSKLRCKIVTWIDVQHKFFPGLANIRACEDKVHVHAAEAQPILGVTVSSIKLAPAADATEVTVKDAVFLHKYRLWVGIAAEALHDVCSRRIPSYSRGVQDNMHSADKLAALNEQTKRAVAGHFHDPERKKKKRKGKKRWKGHKGGTQIVLDLGESGGELGACPSYLTVITAVRIAWAKTRARAMCWTEEVDLLEEEMRRIVEFLQWRSGWWKERVNIRGLSEGPQRGGGDSIHDVPGQYPGDIDGRAGEVVGVGEAEDANSADGAGGAENGEGESKRGRGRARLEIARRRPQYQSCHSGQSRLRIWMKFSQCCSE
ncbi:hypothetical protein B0H14DRAFT_2565252 [Mycena olivaceomarginata]|nr:hypothetical protein B0H14DRAFT_2565252 [Mycena olivaceomarginata]